MDRWSIVTTLNYLPEAQEEDIILAKVPAYAKKKKTITQMVAMANLTREGFKAGDLSTVMSPRTVIIWAENAEIFGDIHRAFRLTFLNKCDDAEKPIIAEYYQRCFDVELLHEQNAA
jgi:cobaltochelatase CobS